MSEAGLQKGATAEVKGVTRTIPARDEQERAMHAFGLEFKSGRLAMLRRVDLPDRCLLVIAHTFAVECHASGRLVLRQRPQELCCTQAPESAGRWPEADFWPLKIARGRRWDLQRLRSAAALLFVAWCRKAFPQLAPAWQAVAQSRTLNQALNFGAVHRHLARQLRAVLPPRFFEVYRLNAEDWLALPAPGAPLRLWTHHFNEWQGTWCSEPRKAFLMAVLAYFPGGLEPDTSIAGSFQRMLCHTLSFTVWHFHRQLDFRQIDSPDLLRGALGHAGAMIVRAAVRGLGLERACGLFRRLEPGFLTELIVAFMCQKIVAHEKPLLHYFGCVFARVESNAAPEILQRELLLVASWLAWHGFEAGYPHSTSTWRSLMRHADAAWPDEEAEPFDWLAAMAPDDWTPPLADVMLGAVGFEGIASSDDLRQEGEEMRHCIAAYEDELRAGRAVAFRVTGALPDGAIVRATALYMQSHRLRRWALWDIVGRENAKVPARLRRIAREAEARFNQDSGGSIARASEPTPPKLK